MARILVHVEGQTEETFVNEVLADHLRGFRHEVSARLLGRAHARGRRGGIRGWPVVRGDLIRHLTEDQTCVVTTMVDYYALPQEGEKAWPGRADAGRMNHDHKAPTITNALSADMIDRMNANYNPARFVPYVMMHEFEALLFSDCERFAQGLYRPELRESLEAIIAECGEPERINDDPETAPSKRVEALVPGYEKPTMGVLAALEIGLEPMRRACPVFDAWVTTLEGLE